MLANTYAKNPVSFGRPEKPSFGQPGINPMANRLPTSLIGNQPGDQDARRRKMMAMALLGGGVLSGLR